jgi:hypothetical protein
MRRKTLGVATAALGLVVATLVPATAQAASGSGSSPSAPPATTAPSGSKVLSQSGAPRGTTNLTAPAAKGLVPDVGIGPNCSGTTDPPFQGGGWVFAEATTNCSIDVAEIYVQSDLYRSRWYGWQHLDYSQDTEYHTTLALVYTSWDCLQTGTYTYEADSYHEADTNTTLSGSTYNDATFGC